jgi:hypothetical protein
MNRRLTRREAKRTKAKGLKDRNASDNEVDEAEAEKKFWPYVKVRNLFFGCY